MKGIDLNAASYFDLYFVELVSMVTNHSMPQDDSLFGCFVEVDASTAYNVDSGTLQARRCIRQ